MIIFIFILALVSFIIIYTFISLVIVLFFGRDPNTKSAILRTIFKLAADIMISIPSMLFKRRHNEDIRKKRIIFYRE